MEETNQPANLQQNKTVLCGGKGTKYFVRKTLKKEDGSENWSMGKYCK
ncbi:hypothetical protein [Anaplasma phagocytophilum]